MKKLEIKQIKVEGLDCFNHFEFKLIDLKDNAIICKNSISDTGQGIDTATEQIKGILRRRGYIQ